MTNTPESAAAFFSARLAFQTDVSDVHTALHRGDPGFVLVDSRGDQSWRQGRIPGAVHLPTADIADRAVETVGRDVAIVTYCWGPGCNGATRAALEFARLGYQVREMLGGIEYWIREGLATETDIGRTTHDADPLTVPIATATCDC